MSNSKTVGMSFAWSSVAEILVKFISPITNMLLARILAPDDFGVIAVCNMVVSFIEIITDAGFGKYLVQYDFKDDDEKDQCANVAFISNLVLSIALWLAVFMFRVPVANLIGNKKHSSAIPVACIHLIFNSMASIQMGLLRRDFEFKKLFVARASVALAPLVITIPLALATKSYWSLIIGNVVGSAINAIVLFICSDWKPRLFYSFELLKKMFSFSFWSLSEAMAHWMIFWVDTFIVGKIYNDYYLGIYKNSSNIVMSIVNMFTAAIVPVLFSALSRIKEEKRFFDIFANIQKLAAYILLPAGIGIFFYRQPITLLLLGSQWTEAADVVGAWALMLVCSVIFYSLPAEAYKARGIPKILFVYQLSYLVFLIPICILTAKSDFWLFVYARCLCAAEQIIIYFVFAKKYLKWNIKALVKNIINPILASLFVVVFCEVIYRDGKSLVVSVASMLAVAVAYCMVLLLFFRKDVIGAIKSIGKL